jgi:hypothetical protein
MIRQGLCCLGLQENKKKACGFKARVLKYEVELMLGGLGILCSLV